jgi:HlyD family type I secretion membrane fusion protein
MKKQRRNHSQEFKREAVALVLEHGYSCAAAGRRLGVSGGLIGRWKRNLEVDDVEAIPGKGKRTAEQQQIHELETENHRLQMEKEIPENPRGQKMTKDKMDRPPILLPIMTACAIVLVFFGGFGAWAALAPLDSAAIAPGRVTVAGNRKTVQHLEGGIIEQLLVKEGDELEADQVLIRLDDTQPRARLELLRGRHDTLRTREARLVAERDKSDAIAFPASLTSRQEESAVSELIAGERSVFDARRRAIQGRADIFRKRIVQLGKEIASLDAQVVAERVQIELIDEERIAVQGLVEKGIMDKTRLLALMRTAAALEGSRGKYEGLIARAEQRVGETELQIIDLENAMLNDVVSELHDVQAQLIDVGERLKAAKDVLERTEIRAPQAGVVVGLNVHTQAGVIAPGQHLLDILPSDDTLVIEAEVAPNDIDVVKVGLAAQIRLTAFKQRNTPLLEGHVTRVSADSFTHEHNGATYFLARVTIDPAEREKLNGGDLYPGMPAEVMVVTGEQTAFEYILTPVTDSFRRAFRED